MFVARACRRYRIKMKHDPRYNRAARRDADARARRLHALVMADRLRQQRKANAPRS
jgi:hypothetical protein